MKPEEAHKVMRSAAWSGCPSAEDSARIKALFGSSPSLSPMMPQSVDSGKLGWDGAVLWWGGSGIELSRVIQRQPDLERE